MVSLLEQFQSIPYCTRTVVRLQCTSTDTARKSDNEGYKREEIQHSRGEMRGCKFMIIQVICEGMYDITVYTCGVYVASLSFVYTPSLTRCLLQ